MWLEWKWMEVVVVMVVVVVCWFLGVSPEGQHWEEVSVAGSLKVRTPQLVPTFVVSSGM